MRLIPIILIGLLLILPTAFVNAGGSSSTIASAASWEGPLVAVLIIIAAVMIAKEIKK